MILAAIILIVFLAVLPVFIKLYKLSRKTVAAVIIAFTVILSGTVCLLQPKMHKPFSIDIIEYFIKINDDGSMTTTKKVTKTVIKDKKRQEGSEK